MSPSSSGPPSGPFLRTTKIINYSGRRHRGMRTGTVGKVGHVGSGTADPARIRPDDDHWWAFRQLPAAAFVAASERATPARGRRRPREWGLPLAVRSGGQAVVPDAAPLMGDPRPSEGTARERRSRRPAAGLRPSPSGPVGQFPQRPPGGDHRRADPEPPGPDDRPWGCGVVSSLSAGSATRPPPLPNR